MVAGGMIRGTITVDGYPKDQATFNRVSGYVEQVPPQSYTLASTIGLGSIICALEALSVRVGSTMPFLASSCPF